MYLFLGHLYKIEVDENVLKSMKETCFPVDINEGISEGYKMIKHYLDSPCLDQITELAVDYAKVFLGAGIVDVEHAAYPYESIYTSPQKLIMQDARDKMFKALQEKNIGLEKGYDIPEDHLFIQLEFMAFLCKEVKNVMNEGDFKTTLLLLNDQKKFVEEHFLNWVPAFCEDVQKHALTNFYKGVAKVTEEYIKMDLAVIEDMTNQYTA